MTIERQRFHAWDELMREDRPLSRAGKIACVQAKELPCGHVGRLWCEGVWVCPCGFSKEEE